MIVSGRDASTVFTRPINLAIPILTLALALLLSSRKMSVSLLLTRSLDVVAKRGGPTSNELKESPS
ncbi:hypothetical protein GCM10007874_43490 [Labrys miyagiensis]|uniref:Uncharacterized protein n=1 Tax=Labrys miyagiensis TaxID=346912 RepID=A0ABQ6CLW2_9HYPH|nr:hypothetical protein [Labrys miyagiensis]GLS21332.1 hypothetical protein GCM10007874_43490 [Labrys miyagiensis]